MPLPRLLLLAALVVAAPAGAEVFRCLGPDGVLRFVDSPHACKSAVGHPLERRLERVPAARDAPARDGPEAGLSALLLEAGEVGSGWEVVHEMAGRPERDADLVRWGVRAQQARHYTRDVAGVVEVCSVELWSFRSLAQAEAAHAGFAYPDWQIEREGEILVMWRGLRRAGGEAPVRGLFPACVELGRRVRARTAAAAEGG